uniref:PHD-type domain-containing protein n=1 Tax=Cannabis sativa TaxID=3483 RepID=A0A803NM43_CANSA
MGGDEGTSNGDGTECLEGLQNEVVNNGNGTTGVAGLSSGKREVLLTYKRRKHMKSCSESKLLDDGKANAKTASPLPLGQQFVKEQEGISMETTCQHKRTHFCMDGLKNCSQKPWKIVLEGMFQSLRDSEGGLKGCIRDALEFCPDTNHVARTKQYDHHVDKRQRYSSPSDSLVKGFQKEASGQVGAVSNGQRCTSLTDSLLKGFQKEASGQVGAVSNGHLDSLNHQSVSEICHRTFFDVVTSEKFTSLCKLMLDHFHEMKIDSFLDYTLINSRIETGAYNQSPLLFLSDIQQGWGKLEEVGAEMISLAKSLSDFSISCYNKQSCHWEPNSHTKVVQREDCRKYRICPCRQCGDKADGRTCLVCDSCEEMYHISCIKPAVEEIPPKSWYCATCATCGIRSQHEKCVVCEKIKETVVKGVGNGSSCTNEATLEGDDSNCVTDEERTMEKRKRVEHCKICNGAIREGDNIKICVHSFCPCKLYHARCLTKKQLKSYSTTGWYCPSCLCRTCLTDRDDEKIILCDGCDYAFHLYCLQPKLTSFPEGKWFCNSCNVKLQTIRTAKRAYESSSNKQMVQGHPRTVTFGSRGKLKRKGNMGSDKSGGGMEMLLSAVNTLHSYETDMAGI